MSSKPNHRRGHGRIQGNGPRWEGPNPEDGCNSTHVARARRWWRKHERRVERRTNKNGGTGQRSGLGPGRPPHHIPSTDFEEFDDE